MSELVLNLNLMQIIPFTSNYFSYEHLAIIQLAEEGRQEELKMAGKEALFKLEQRGWIKIVDSEVFLREPAKDFLKINTEAVNFDEFWELYPTKTGYRVLRAITKDSKDYVTAKRKYLSIVKTAKKHKLIIEALTKEVVTRQREGSMKFMQGIMPYINQHTWERYMGVPTPDKDSSDYGIKEL